MKYMGSKRWMLENGLGHLLYDRAMKSDRFIDLFSGTAAVSWHIAERVDIPVLSIDLQAYSAVMARSVLNRTEKIDSEILIEEWVEPAKRLRTRKELWPKALEFDASRITGGEVQLARQLCSSAEGVITRSYGGYYFSPAQSVTIDALLQALPPEEPLRSASLTSLIWAVMRSVAAPGHTAQPFQPTSKAMPYLRESWEKDPLEICTEVLPSICSRSARRIGKAAIGDALEVAKVETCSTDLVFLDPPYSAVQYSRFYHVLETVARGACGEVSGTGRYPPPDERPKSAFSLVSEARLAMDALLGILGRVGCSVVMTFPQHNCSNGITGEALIPIARRHFEVDVVPVRTRHSTLGGNNTARSARRQSVELILSMRPRRSKSG